MSQHRNTKGIEIDLQHPRGKRSASAWSSGGDLGLENYRVGARARLWLGYEAAAARNSGIT